MSLWRASGTSMMGKPDRLGVWTPSRSSSLSTAAVLRQRSARMASPRFSFTSRPTRTVARDAIGDGPEYRYGGAAVFSRRLRSGEQVRKAASDEYAFDRPETSTTLTYASPV